MKLPQITAYVHSFTGIEPLAKGFRQYAVLWIPEAKDEMGTTIRKEQFYRVETWSNAQTDLRFFNSTHIKLKIKATCYLNGERWMSSGATDFSYATKLKLSVWEKAN